MAAGAGFGMPMPGDWIDRISTEADTAAATVKRGFLAAAGRQGLSVRDAAGAGASVSWREATGYGPRCVADRARFFDLVVLGRSERVVDRPYTDTVEETLMYSGRPVLLAPARLPAAVGERIAIGESNVATGYAWLTAGDDQVEEDCLENEDASPIGIDEEFPNGDDPHVGCRCAIIPWTEPIDEEDNIEAVA